MATEPIITNERVDDIPVLLTQIEHMGIQRLIDKHFPTHGNWQGQSLGQVGVIWLTHILSQADHRLNHVQAWAGKRLETLKAFFGDSLRSLDLTDDRLEAVLRYLDRDTNWYSFEKELGGSLLQVYDIQPERIRLDSTTASSHCGRYRTTGLFQIDIQIKRVQKVKRRYLQRPPKYFEEIDINLDFQIDEDAVTQEIKLLGWRVYVTNQINTKLDLKQA